MLAFVIILITVLCVLACIRGWYGWGFLPVGIAFCLVMMFERGGTLPGFAVWLVNLSIWPPLFYMVITGERGRELAKEFTGKTIVAIRDFDAIEAMKKLKERFWAD